MKRERIKLKVFIDRKEAKRDVFDYIEMFYNAKRQHGYNNGLSPVKFERQYFSRLESV
jgi:putative transposase